MSTKIYHAWRFSQREHGVFEMAAKIERAARKTIVDKLKMFVRRAKIQDNPSARDEIYRLFSAHTKRGITSLQRDMFDMNMVFYLRTAGDYALVLPADDHHKLDRIGRIRGLDDFSYWNNTDMPEGMDPKEWEARGKFWYRYWKPKNPSIQVSALSIIEPGLEIADILLPDMFGVKVPKGYWGKANIKCKPKKKKKRKSRSSKK